MTAQWMLGGLLKANVKLCTGSAVALWLYQVPAQPLVHVGQPWAQLGPVVKDTTTADAIK